MLDKGTDSILQGSYVGCIAMNPPLGSTLQQRCGCVLIFLRAIREQAFNQIHDWCADAHQLFPLLTLEPLLGQTRLAGSDRAGC
jgi:hypothetical protein